ncbi:hypothetical protein ACP4OV_022302 [Aristida adscensionis]
MEGEWSGLGLRALSKILHIGVTTSARHLVGLAHGKLEARAAVLETLRTGAMPRENDLNVLDASPVRACPSVVLAQAHRAVSRQLTDLAGAGRALALFGGARPGLRDTPRWRAWLEHHGRAVQRARILLVGLRIAMGHVLASTAAFRVARTSTFPHLSAEWEAWMAEAEGLTSVAYADAEVALEMVAEMSQAAREAADDAFHLVLRNGQG